MSETPTWWITLCLDGEPVTKATAVRPDGWAVEMWVTESRSGRASWRALSSDGVYSTEIGDCGRLLLVAGCVVRFPGFTVS